MKVIANRQIHGVYGTRNADEPFDVPDYLAVELLKLKRVRLPEDDTYSVKAIQPSVSTSKIEHNEPKLSNKRK